MPSRREYRAENKKPKATRKHWLSTIVGVIAAVVLFACLFVHTTILNESYMSTEIINSGVGKQVKNSLNASLSSYGIDEQIITTKQTNKLLKQGIKQIYQGKPVKLDYSEVLDGLENKADNTLSSYGLPSSLISELPTGSLNSQVSSALNSKINTQQIQEVESDIKLANGLTITGIVVSVVVLVLIAVRNLISRTIIRDFRWITLISGIISAALLSTVKPLVQNYSADMASFSSVVQKITDDVVQVGWQMVLVNLVIAGVLFIISFIFHRRRA